MKIEPLDLSSLLNGPAETQKLQAANDTPRFIRRRSIEFDDDAENHILRIYRFFLEEGVRPLNEQKTVEFALALALNPEAPWRSIYESLKAKDKRLTASPA
ncbi:hypothetical protein [Cerasicoccus arenae]|uniref:Uncharacterized protein n=1 Tax=Cerasicoccus arenae TaxID=424488 RepID=A0A8J3DJT9_9BACT|nr:hypothetical protein [Cerasicoccus arenae]MBK1857761.1 hypothetical protein [Cerasicoccus arenae]GHC11904.1 hypothetical protein GCM10007047_31560 [Cerasicoccus arenae]